MEREKESEKKRRKERERGFSMTNSLTHFSTSSKNRKINSRPLHQVGSAAWSLAVAATLLGLSHPAVDKVLRKRERGEERQKAIE